MVKASAFRVKGKLVSVDGQLAIETPDGKAYTTLRTWMLAFLDQKVEITVVGLLNPNIVPPEKQTCFTPYSKAKAKKDRETAEDSLGRY